MADIFISYAHEDFGIVEQLSQIFEEQGLSVWWDHQLDAGSQFRRIILDELLGAKAVLVVWSRYSIDSEFVIDEADEARKAEKLISVSVPELDLGDLPLGFRNRHTIKITETSKIERSLVRLGLISSNNLPNIAPRKIIPTTSETPDCGVLKPTDEYGYVEYTSDVLGVDFSYPSNAMVLDTTRHKEGYFEFVSEEGHTEIKIFSSALESTVNVRAEQQVEQSQIEELGYRLTYIAPQLEKNWSNWYVLSGLTSDRQWFYYRRWYFSNRVISIEYEYSGDRREFYNDVIPKMTLEKFHILDI